MEKPWGKNCRVLLVLPGETAWVRGGQRLFHRVWQPLDLANAAGLLEERGFSVRIVDQRVERLPAEKLKALGLGHDLVFVASAPYDRWQCPPLYIDLFFETVRLFPPEKTILLGPHVTERADLFLRGTGALAAVLGEPELTILDLACCGGSRKNFDDIDGLAFFRDGCLIRTRPRRAADMAMISKPAFHLLDMGKYSYSLMDRPFTLLEGSRGCPFNCRFCYKGMYPYGYRQKKPGDLAADVIKVKDRFKVRSVYFMDLEFALDREFLHAFCKRMIAMKTGVTWCCQTRAGDLDRESLILMKKAGCTLIHMGVESGSERLLKASGKGLGLGECRRAVLEAKHQGIRTALFFNVGFPGETDEDREKTLAAALGLDPDYASFHMLIPYPGTPWAKEAGISMDLYPPGVYPSFFHTEHDERTLKNWLRRAYGKFYLRPSAIIRMIARERRHLHEKIPLFLKHWLHI